MARIELQYPIVVDGRTITSVAIRRPNGKGMAALNKHLATLSRVNADGAVPDASAFKAMVGAIAALTGLSEEQAGDLDILDINAIAAAAFNEFANWPGRGMPGTARRH